MEDITISEQKTQAIKQRILDEQRKHPTLDWAEIAARKINEAFVKAVQKESVVSHRTDMDGRLKLLDESLKVQEELSKVLTLVDKLMDELSEKHLHTFDFIEWMDENDYTNHTTNLKKYGWHNGDFNYKTIKELHKVYLKWKISKTT